MYIKKLESGKLTFDYRPVKIDDLIKNLVKSIQQKINEKQSLELRLQYDNKIVIYVDIFRIKQILFNFLTNALKFTIDGYILILVEETDKVIKFTVEDTGRGIKDEEMKFIFSPFHQTDKDDSIRHNGIGLGLYLCKMLTESMHGTIGFESTYRKGSKFWVEFPLDKTIYKENV